jgi:site-specific recombinase XerD
MATHAAHGEAAAIGRLVHDFCWCYAPTHLTSSEHTLRGYRSALELYLRYLDTVGVTPATLSASDFCRERIESFLAWLSDERGNSPRTCNVRLSAIRVFCRYASRHDATMVHLEAESLAVPNRKAPKTSDICNAFASAAKIPPPTVALHTQNVVTKFHATNVP